MGTATINGKEYLIPDYGMDESWGDIVVPDPGEGGDVVVPDPGSDDRTAPARAALKAARYAIRCPLLSLGGQSPGTAVAGLPAATERTG